jgi:2-amino-4-hydroxy-6-hydroxymethyldihydropteridine diphosphokinase
MNTCYLLLGTNIGDRLLNLKTATEHLQKEIGNILSRSSVYSTAPWGNTDQADFLNEVLAIETFLRPEELMKKILEIEEGMGRIRTERNAPRIIDIDILFYNNEVIDIPDLHIPHKEIQNRRFVLIPVKEIAPQLTHPGLHKSIETLLKECPDKLEVKLFKTA